MMGDLIDRDAAIEYLMTNMGWHDEDGYAVDDADEKRRIITDLVNGIPAVDAAPVVHGRWVRTDSDTTSAIEYSCSICGDRAPMGYMRQNAKTEYCPHCGARMDA